MTSPPRIFISYARSDGAAFAAKLAAQLRDEGLAVWQDLLDLESGVGWWAQIDAALRTEAEHLVLVLTPAAARSVVVTREWRLAREQGVQISIVYDAASRPDPQTLPRALPAKHWADPDTPENWHRLLATLRGPSRQDRVPFMAGDHDRRFVPRAGKFKEIRQLLLRPSAASIGLSAALRGSGGFGKTVLARALCHDEAIQDRFFDGIVWVTLGRQVGDLAGLITELTRQFRPETPTAASLDGALAAWRDALKAKSCLLVIDDVWRRDHLAPFLEGGSQVSRLITTRDEGVLGADVSIVPVDAMEPDEAADLLGANLSTPAFSLEARHGLARLAANLHHWPLLLGLANGAMLKRVRRREPPQATILWALSEVRRSGIAAFDLRDPKDRQEAVRLTLGLSLDELGEADARRFLMLGGFVEDADIPIALAARLWHDETGLDLAAADDLVIRLHEMSLIDQCDLALRTLRLHDVLADFAAARLDAGSAKALHGALCAALRATAEEPAVQSYRLRHQPRHMARAEDPRLAALLADLAWQIEKIDRLGPAAAIDDLQTYGTEAEHALLCRILMLVSPALAAGADELPAQLLARLDPELWPGADLLLAAARRNVPNPALFLRGIGLAAPGAELLRLFGHGAAVTSAAVSFDGMRVLTTCQDGLARVFDAKTGRMVADLCSTAGAIRCGAFAPDGRLATTGSDRGSVEVWDVATGDLLRLVHHPSAVIAIAIAPDGSSLMAGSEDGQVLQWGSAGAEPARAWRCQAGRLIALSWSGPAAWAVTTTKEHAAQVWDLHADKRLVQCRGHRGEIICAAVSPARHRLVTAGYDAARVWDLQSGAEVTGFDRHEGPIYGVAFSPDGETIASCSYDGSIRLWDTATAAETAVLKGHTEAVRSVAFAPAADRIASGSDDTSARIWDAVPNPQATGRALQAGSWINDIDVSPDGRWVLVAGSDHCAEILDAETRRLIATLPHPADQIATARFSPDGRAIVTATRDERARLWCAATGACQREFAGHDSSLTAAAFAPDRRHIVTASFDKTLRVFDIATGEQRLMIGPGPAIFNDARFSPDGGWILAAASDLTATLWDAATGALVRTLSGHSDRVKAALFSPDGTRIVTTAYDRTARIWDARGGNTLRLLTAHAFAVVAADFSPDGAWLVTADAGGQICLWGDRDKPLARFHFDGHVSSVRFAPHRNSVFVAEADRRWHELRIVTGDHYRPPDRRSNTPFRDV